MNPAQLLNPKAFAKDKAKKRAPNYGPQQTRKPKTLATEGQAKVNIPVYDPKALLAPKSASKASEVTRTEKMESDESNNLGHLFERHHNVKDREAPDTVKRKVDANDDDGDDPEKKKQKTQFGDVGRGGIIGEHLKKEREALAKAQSNGPTIDLTDDKDDDVVVVKEVSKAQVEVCLGMLEVKANCSIVPTISLRGSKFGKDFWPVAKVWISRERKMTSIVELLDTTKQPFGRLEPQAATHIANLMDGAKVSQFNMKAFLKQRPRKKEKAGDPISQALYIMLVLYSPRDKADMIGRYLSQHQLYLKPPPDFQTSREYYNPQDQKKTFGPATQHAVAGRITGGSVTGSAFRTVEEKERAVNDLFTDLTRGHDDIAEMDADSSIISTTLLSHQKKALRFLVDHEDEENVIKKHSLWKLERKGNYKEVWVNAITGLESSTKPESSLGGILADMMGLGKTLSILALIASTKSQARQFQTSATLPDDLRELQGANMKATLIVCPTSVLTNWQEQIKQHIHAKQCRTLLYHGSSRTQNVEELAKYHIVITSYGILSAEAKSVDVGRQILRRMNWFRIVLDEAHQIRNATTEVAKAACALTAQRRWAVTGTPVQNRLDDLGALIRFIRLKPFDDPVTWSQYIIAPFKNAKMEVLKDLRILVDSVTLRRSKDTIGLPARQENIIRLNFSDEESELYNAFAAQSNRQLQSIVRQDKKLRGASYVHVLKALLRLRQICDHGREMLSEEDMKDVAGYNQSNYIDLGDDPELTTVEQSFTTARVAYETFEIQVSSDADFCVQCAGRFVVDDAEQASSQDDETDEDASDADSKSNILGLLTPCFHLLHAKCKHKFDERAQESIRPDGYHDCPECGAYNRLEYFTLTKKGYEEYQEDKIRRARTRKQANFNSETYVPHTKVKTLVEELRKSAAETAALPAGEPPIRSVVFTEWTTYLDLIEVGLLREGINFVRLDGSMTVKARTASLQRFRTDPDIAVLLVSIKAGGQGLNFTAANKVYVMEPQFNPGVEAQAVDRVHRLGQTRAVEITHFIMAKSAEEAIVELQKKKQKLAALSMEKKLSNDDTAKQRIEEIQSLFKR